MSDEPVIDVERLVADVRRRVENTRARGGYALEVGAGPLDAPKEARIRFRPEVSYSSKPVVGRPLTALKRVLLRLNVHAFHDLARQTDQVVTESELRLDDLLERMEQIEASLQRLQLGPRLARLERTARPAPREGAPAVAEPAGEAAGGAPATGLDYLVFEARFRGPEERIQERQRVYLDLLRDRRLVLDIGCGRGELLQLLAQSGTSAYGIEREPDFVALGRERGLDVREGDGLAHLAGLDPGAVDAVVLSHVVEHLSPTDVWALIAGAHAALAPGGMLIMETPNPESLVAGSVNFHRDPTHLRPVHPDTLAFACESAGFEPVVIMRLSPVPEHERLPRVPAAEPGAEHVNRIVDRLDALLYGFQDYAVAATRPA